MRKKIRDINGYSLLETMTVVAVLGVVIGLLYAYSDEGWKQFYSSYSRGLSQTKAKLAIRILTDDLREANRRRIYIGRGISFGVPTPDDISEEAPLLYFTKPVFLENTGETIGYDYILYYYAKRKKNEYDLLGRSTRKEKEEQLTLKSIRFLNQSKYYTEDEGKTWPFQPPILEINKSTLPEDEQFISYVKSMTANITEELPEQETIKQNTQAENVFLDHFSKLKKLSRNIPVSGNFQANSLTDSFKKDDLNIYFTQSYKTDMPISIKVTIHESPYLFGIMSAVTQFEVKVTPRN
jgi:hypothetical protein